MLSSLSLGSTASWKTSSDCCGLATSRACFCSLPFSSSSSKCAIARAIPRPSGLGLGFNSGCFAHWRPSSASSSKRSCCLVMALPSIILGRMILWSFLALAHTGFLAWYTKEWFMPRDGMGASPECSNFEPSQLSEESHERFLSEASNINPTIIQHQSSHHPTPFPSRFPGSSKKCRGFFGKVQETWDCGSGAGQTWHLAAKEDHHLQSPKVCWVRYIKIWYES